MTTGYIIITFIIKKKANEHVPTELDGLGAYYEGKPTCIEVTFITFLYFSNYGWSH